MHLRITNKPTQAFDAFHFDIGSTGASVYSRYGSWCIRSGGEELKKVDLGRLVGVLANIGVIVGILFLAYEINQANVTTRAEMVSSCSHFIVPGHHFSTSTPKLLSFQSDPDLLFRTSPAD